ncbi:copper chaperone PCu(A)C [Shewanella sp. SR44-3]|uniref:copper chaperone PCu(A)C n=1 Tax=unclassified Shewanella TaxID=196818 RepID=UPI0015FB9BE1|nr:copper chaperone PCu(A)C [Shewanella sp. SR44-3]MBB1270697.1 copper chaperone PCu(A)C [Shewanella sp. SR44-3]
MKKTASFIGLLLSAGLALAALSSQALAADMMAVDAWSRAMPPTARVLPVYLTLHNHSDKKVSLIKISSDFGAVELHKTVMENDMMRMQPVGQIAVQAKQQVKLAPMGLHAMITGLTQGVPAEGNKLPLTLVFDNGEEINITALVRKATMPAKAAKHDHH